MRVVFCLVSFWAVVLITDVCAFTQFACCVFAAGDVDTKSRIWSTLKPVCSQTYIYTYIYMYIFFIIF